MRITFEYYVEAAKKHNIVPFITTVLSDCGIYAKVDFTIEPIDEDDVYYIELTIHRSEAQAVNEIFHEFF